MLMYIAANGDASFLSGVPVSMTNQVMNRYIQSSFVAIIPLLLTACGGKKDEKPQGPPPATPVTVTTVTKGDATYYDEYPATITALISVDIQPQVAGNITGIFFQDGQRVRKGQKLYTIDAQQYQANYNQAIANLNVQKANLNRAQKDANRYNTLASQDAVATQMVDNANATLQAAQMQVAAAEANARAVQTNLKYTTIYAPMDGTIGISQVRMGAAVAPGSMPLNTISSDSPIAADVQADEAQIARFVKLQNQKQNPRDSTLTLVLPGGERYAYPGLVRITDRAVDSQTGTLRVRIAFPNPNKSLKVGMNANIRVKNSTDKPEIIIPYKAVTEQMSEYFAYVVGDSSKVTQRKLTLGSRIGGNVVVQKGLNEGDKVVTEGTQKIKDGAKVKVNLE